MRVLCSIAHQPNESTLTEGHTGSFEEIAQRKNNATDINGFEQLVEEPFSCAQRAGITLFESSVAFSFLTKTVCSLGLRASHRKSCTNFIVVAFNNALIDITI